MRSRYRCGSLQVSHHLLLLLKLHLHVQALSLSAGKLVGINLSHHGSLISLSDLGLNTATPASAHGLHPHAHVHLLLLGIVLRVLEPGAHLPATSGHIPNGGVAHVASDVVHATTSSHHLLLLNYNLNVVAFSLTIFITTHIDDC